VPPARHDCLVVCTPGLETVLHGELTALGVRTATPTRGGVAVALTERQLYAVNLWARTATRVLVRIGSFPARTFAELEDGAATLAWHRYLGGDRAPVFRVSASASRLYHSGAIAQRLAAACGRPPGLPGDIDAGTGQLVVVRLHRNRCTVSVDSSGAALHRRGWRLATAKAPLRETLAAALLLAAGWDGTTPLVDPFCGSGTIPIEAALLARDLAPGLGRGFAFQHWGGFRPGTWASVMGEARRRARPAAEVALVASDRDEGAVTATRANAERAGVLADVEVSRRTVSDVVPPAGTGPGWLLTNPPYGSRVGGGDLRNLHARLGRVARERLPGWRVGLLVVDPRLAGHTGLALHEALRTTNGGIDVRLLVTTPA
jgi:putative N6-adenine-specific DNA methylase